MKNSGKSVGKPENLTPWQPGESGNPKGRPPGRSISSILKDLLNKNFTNIDPFEKGQLKERPINEHIAIKLANMALKGDISSIKEIFDRTEGKPPQKLEHTGDANNPLSINVKVSND